MIESMNRSRCTCNTMQLFVSAFIGLFAFSTMCKACPDFWTNFNGKCYKTSPEAMDWYAAQQYCISEGGYLIEIETEEEQVSLFNILSEELHYWIGLADFANEGTWIWQHSYSAASYFYWAPGEPNESGSEDCVHLRCTEAFAWNDNECDRTAFDDHNIHALCETEDAP